MSEANPATPDAAPAAPDSSSLDDKLAAKFGLDEPTAQTETPEPEAREATSEPTDPDVDVDIPADDPPQTGDEYLEVDRHGEKRRLSKEEAKRFAQMGLDYSTNVERLKGEEARITQYKQALEQQAKVTPEVVEARANVVAYERALGQYKNVDWAQLAQTDPISYTQHRAQFDALRDQWQQASGHFQETLGKAQQVETAVTEAELAQQRTRLYEIAPELRDPQRMQAEQGRMVKFLQDIGADASGLQFVSRSADAFAIVRDAMRYRAAVQAKAQKQSTPQAPSMRPGPAPTRQNQATQKADTVKALHQAKDPARKKELLDQALALKFGLK